MALIIFLTVIYFIPTFNAISRKHRNCGAIFTLNLLLGWTFLFWVIAMVWSATDYRERG